VATLLQRVDTLQADIDTLKKELAGKAQMTESAQEIKQLKDALEKMVARQDSRQEEHDRAINILRRKQKSDSRPGWKLPPWPTLVRNSSADARSGLTGSLGVFILFLLIVVASPIGFHYAQLWLSSRV
jgi:hypothetical protein